MIEEHTFYIENLECPATFDVEYSSPPFRELNYRQSGSVSVSACLVSFTIGSKQFTRYDAAEMTSEAEVWRQEEIFGERIAERFAA